MDKNRKIGNIEEIEKALTNIESMRVSSGMANALASMEAMKISSGIADAYKSMDAIKVSSGMASALASMEAMKVSPGIADSFKSMEAIKVRHKMAQVMKSMEAIKVSPEMAKALKGMESIKVSSSMAGALDNIKSLSTYSSALSTLHIENFINPGENYSNSIGKYANDVSNVIAPVEYKEICKNLGRSKSENEFFELFKSLNPLVQATIIFSFINVVLPMLVSVSSNIVTPHVQNYLNFVENKSSREMVAEIKKLPTDKVDIVTTHLRFITGNNVRLREEPSTKSIIVDELAFGQVVKIISKEKNWIEVSYSYGDNEREFRGWVFTRYTAKFLRSKS